MLPALDTLAKVASVEVSEQHLEATYFDTPDLSLIAAGIRIRRRTGGDDAGWHLKLPVGGAHEEVRLSLSRAKASVPKPLRDTVPVFVGEQPLAAVATLTTERTAHRLLGKSGRVLAEVADDRVTAEVAGSTTTWREWEVELVDGSATLLAAAADLLCAAGATPGSSPSKLARALGERMPSPPQTRGGARSRKQPASHVLQARLAEQVRELRHRDPLVRRGLPGGVHKMRIAIRRLRSLLASARPLLDAEITEPLRAELGWLGGELGRARDAEVQSARLLDRLDRAHAAEGSWPHRVRGALGRDLATRYRLAHREAVDALTSERYLTLLRRLDELVAEPPWTARAARPAGPELTRAVRRDWKRLEKRVAAARELTDPVTHAQRLHDVRKAAKRARYAAEPLVALFGKDAKRFVSAMKQIQTVLGEHQDTVAARAQLRDLAEQAEHGRHAFAYGVLHVREEAEAERLEAAFGRVWRESSRPKLRRWL